MVPFHSVSQLKWDGGAGDGLWASAANWVGDIVPSTTDNILLDNSVVPGNYTVSIPGGVTAVTVKSISISPSAGNSIQFIIPSSNIAIPGFTTTGPGYGVKIDAGGVFMNASGITSMSSLLVNDSIQVNNGGQYIHNTRSAHAALVTVLSKMPGTETGIFTFDAPGGGYTIASTNRTYGTLILSAAASGGSQVYASSAASPLNINGNFIVEAGVTVNLDLTAATTIKGNYIQQGGILNLAGQPNNNTVYIKGDFVQAAGVITETSTGLPAIELNGSSNQNIQLAGTIVNSVDFRINNNAGVSLLSGLSLPYRLTLLSGMINTNSFLVTLQPDCDLIADAFSNNNFINGALRKEGLSADAQFLFPVGKDITKRWLTLKNVSGNYTVEFFKANPKTLAAAVGSGIHHISSIEYWSVQPDALPVPSAAIELSFDDANSGGVTDLSTLKVAQLAAGTWIDKGNTATTGTAGSAGSVAGNTVSAFAAGNNYFTLASSDAFQNPLPLRLVSFTSNVFNGMVAINWKIAAAWQPVFFELQSSPNGNHFETVSKIFAAPGQTGYQYSDKNPLNSKIYYRLRIEEDNNLVFYSGTIVNKLSALIPFQLQPSIVKSHASLLIQTVNGGKAAIKIYSMEGRLMQTENAFLYSGSNKILLQLRQLKPGIYTVCISGIGNTINTCRFIKVE